MKTIDCVLQRGCSYDRSKAWLSVQMKRCSTLVGEKAFDPQKFPEPLLITFNFFFVTTFPSNGKNTGPPSTKMAQILENYFLTF